MFDGTLVKLIKFPAEHLTIFHGTLVFRGTPVENHYSMLTTAVFELVQQFYHATEIDDVVNAVSACADWPKQTK